MPGRRFGLGSDIDRSSSSSSDYEDIPEPCTLRPEDAEMAGLSAEVNAALLNLEARVAATEAENARLRAQLEAPGAVPMALDRAEAGAGNVAHDFRLPREFSDKLKSDGSNTALWKMRLLAFLDRLECKKYLEEPNYGVGRTPDGMVETNWRVRAIRALLLESITTEAVMHLEATLGARNPGKNLTDVHPQEIYSFIMKAWTERSVGAKHDLTGKLNNFEMFEGELISHMFERAMTLWNDMTIATCTVNEEMIVEAIVRATGNHPEYDTMAAVLMKDTTLSFNSAKVQLQAWETRLNSRRMGAPVRANPSSSASPLALALPAPLVPDPMATMMAAMAEMMDAKLNAFSHHGGGRGNGRGRGRGSGRGGMQGVQCYNCHGYGHVKSACPQLTKKAT